MLLCVGMFGVESDNRNTRFMFSIRNSRTTNFVLELLSKDEAPTAKTLTVSHNIKWLMICPNISNTYQIDGKHLPNYGILWNIMPYYGIIFWPCLKNRPKKSVSHHVLPLPLDAWSGCGPSSPAPGPPQGDPLKTAGLWPWKKGWFRWENMDIIGKNGKEVGFQHRKIAGFTIQKWGLSRKKCWIHRETNNDNPNDKNDQERDKKLPKKDKNTYLHSLRTCWNLWCSISMAEGFGGVCGSWKVDPLRFLHYASPSMAQQIS